MLRDRIEYWRHKAGTYVPSKRIGGLSPNKVYVSFTFDTEEDWDNNNQLYYHSMVYYNSYKYILSGIFYQLLNGLCERGIGSTFYVTYNLARDMPEVLKYLVEKNQAIGVHLHPHHFQEVTYPYNAGETGDKITSYSYHEKIKWMKTAKDKIESVVGHRLLLCRSGQLACDSETEKAAKSLGFKAISNHKGIYYMKMPGIWNLGVGQEDLLDSSQFDEVSKYLKYFEKRTRSVQIVVFSSHPMLLYDHSLDKVREEQLNTFFGFVDYLNNDDNVEIISQYQLLEMVEEQGM